MDQITERIRDIKATLREAIGKKCEDCREPLGECDVRRQYCDECRHKRVRLNYRNWRERHPEKARAKRRRDYLNDIPAQRAQTRRWRENNPDRSRQLNREAARRRLANHPERERARKRERYIRIGGIGYRKNTTIAAIIDRDGMICSWCGQFLENPYDGALTHIDHIVAGGPSDLDNLQMLHAFCNISKKDRPMSASPLHAPCNSSKSQRPMAASPVHATVPA